MAWCGNEKSKEGYGSTAICGLCVAPILQHQEANNDQTLKEENIMLNDLRVANLIELKAVQMKLKTLKNKTKTVQHAQLAKNEISDVKSILKTRCVGVYVMYRAFFIFTFQECCCS